MSGYKYYMDDISPVLSEEERYVRDGKHLLGCAVKVFSLTPESDINYVTEKNLKEVMKNLKTLLFFKDDITITTYRNYMEFHYPEYKHIWSIQ